MRDDDSYVEYMTARWSVLYRLAYLLTGSSTTAEDLLQGVLERAYVAWPKVQRADQPDAYVRRMLVNASISESRRGYRREFLTTRLPEVPTSDSMVGTVDRATLWPLIRQLPPRQRAVVVLRYYEDLSEAQIAAVDHGLAYLIESAPSWDEGFVAINGGQVVGFAASRFSKWNSRLTLCHMYVDGSARRLGVGTALLHAIIDSERAASAQHVWLETQTDNVPAIRAYERMGFRLVGLDQTLYGDRPGPTPPSS